MHKRIEIRYPGELRRVVLDIDRAMQDGLLVEEGSTDEDFTLPRQVPFSDLVAGSPGGDVLDYRFVCPESGARFQLGVETYHGSGGCWQLTDV